VIRLLGLIAVAATLAGGEAAAAAPQGVAPQYGSTHVYVAPDQLDRFVASFVAAFGGKASPPATLTVTPTPSSTRFVAVSTPAGLLSVFAFATPIPYPFGAERTGYLVADMAQAVTAARAAGAEVVVAPFADPIGRDAVIRWPGGVVMQLYWHTAPPSAPPLATLPENRVYVSADRADAFIRDFAAFSGGQVTSDTAAAPGVEVGQPGGTYRRVRMQSAFGRLVILVSDGWLAWPYGREVTGYEVKDLAQTLAQAAKAGAEVLTGPYSADGRDAAMVRFPGGYIAEVHATALPRP
jgi:predicted enzyme related to lactoylglutathione lyase